MSMLTTSNLDPDVLGVQVLSEVGRRQPFERRAVRVLLGESLAAVLRDLANEEQVVPVAGDEVGYVTAARQSSSRISKPLRSGGRP